MGSILEATPEMGPYRVEARRESFYLNSPQTFRPTGDGVALPTADQPAVLAALDQVAAFLRNRVPDGGRNVTLHRDGGMLAITGGDWLHVYGCDQGQTGCIEIEYTHLHALRSALAAA